MRIACLNQDPGITPQRAKGGAVHLLAMRRALEESGAQVLAVDAPEDDAVLRFLEEAEASGGLDLVYERYSLRSGVGARFSRAHGIPFVVEINAPLSREQVRWRGGSVDGELRDREVSVIDAADLVLAVSTQVADYAIERGARPERVEVAPNGVDVRRFRPRAPDDSLRAELLPPGRFVLGFHGRVRPWHGIERLVALTAELLAGGAPVHLLLVGEGEVDLGPLPGDAVTRVPWVDHDEVGRYVALFDALVLTHSGREEFYFSPLKLAEAMACGVVPVVPRLGDLPRCVRDGQEGLVVPPDDDAALLTAVRTLHADEAYRRRLATAAMRRAEGNGWERIAERVLAVAGRAAEIAGDA